MCYCALLDLALQADSAAEADPGAVALEGPGLRLDAVCIATSRGQLYAMDVGVTMSTLADGTHDGRRAE